MGSSLGADAMLTDHEPPGKNGPLTPALSPSEGERGNGPQLSSKARFMGRVAEAGRGEVHGKRLVPLGPAHEL